MRSVIVTVQLASQDYGVDLEVPADVEAGRLAGLLARALDECVDPGEDPYQIEAFPPGRVLEPDETLAGAAAWDGAWLLLLPK